MTCCILFLNHSHHYFVVNIDDIYVNNLVFLLFMLLFCCFRQIVCYLLMLQINIFVELRFYCCCFSYIYYLNGPEVTLWTADQRSDIFHQVFISLDVTCQNSCFSSGYFLLFLFLLLLLLLLLLVNILRAFFAHPSLIYY